MKTLLLLLMFCHAALAGGVQVAATQWSPNCEPNVSAWWSPRTKVNFSGTSTVNLSTVPDLSGNARTATGQATPTLIYNQFHGFNAARMTNTASQYFSFTAFNPGNTYTAMAVLKFPSLATYQTGQGYVVASTSANIQLASFRGDNGKMSLYDNANGNLFSTSVPNFYNAFALMEVVNNAGTPSFYTNGVSIGFGGSGTGGSGMTVNAIGNVVGIFCTFDWTDIVIFGGVLNTPQRQRVEEYFRTR